MPADWKPNIVQGKGYDDGSVEGRLVLERLAAISTPISLGSAPALILSEPPIAARRFGAPTITYPRLGQGSFRVLVTDMYVRERRAHDPRNGLSISTGTRATCFGPRLAKVASKIRQ